MVARLSFKDRDYQAFLSILRLAKARRCLVGRETFQKQVEAMTGRRLVSEARGRPKKTARTTIEKVL